MKKMDERNKIPLTFDTLASGFDPGTSQRAGVAPLLTVMSGGFRARKSVRSITGIGRELQPDFVTTQEPGRERRVITRVDRFA